MVSYFSRLNYDFNEKYYISLSYRRDGSSRFGADKKYGDFYSVGASWRLSSESFMPQIDWLDDARFRFSYGTSGNENIDNYLSKGLFEYGYNYDGQPGMQQVQLANPLLTWEQNEVLDVALDFRLFNRISATVDYYVRTSNDLLLEKPLSMTSGFDNIISNIGEMKNYGWEIELISSNIETDDFKWITNLNFTQNKNEWTELPQDQILDGSKVWEVGYSRYEFYIREWAGVDPATGEAMWYIHEEGPEGERTGEKTLTKNYTEATRTYMGSALPDFYGGLTNNFSFFNFDLSILFHYSIGGLFYDYDEAELMHDGATPSTNLLEASKDAWKQPGDVTNVPRYVHQNSSNSNERSSRFLHDASYVRMKNITLAYNLPRSVCNRIKVDNARIFVQGDNLLTWSAYRNRDPEGNLAGTANTLMPNIKTFTVGLRLGL
jgi:TonB-linked SusC/RagA family outer membrane protein